MDAKLEELGDANGKRFGSQASHDYCNNTKPVSTEEIDAYGEFEPSEYEEKGRAD